MRTYGNIGWHSESERCGSSNHLLATARTPKLKLSKMHTTEKLVSQVLQNERKMVGGGRVVAQAIPKNFGDVQLKIEGWVENDLINANVLALKTKDWNTKSWTYSKERNLNTKISSNIFFAWKYQSNTASSEPGVEGTKLHTIRDCQILIRLNSYQDLKYIPRIHL